MNYTYSLWASDARVLLQEENALENFMFTVRPGGVEENNYYVKQGYIHIGTYSRLIERPKLKDVMPEVTAAIEAKIQDTRAEAEKTVQELKTQLQNLLALSYEAEGE